MILTAALKAAKGKTIYPNAALYTAAVCSIVGFPYGVEDLLFIMARLPVWAESGIRQATKQ